MPGLSEVERGRSEAAHTILVPTDVTSYLNPPADTPFPLRYAFYLLGDVRDKTVLDIGCGSGENLAPLLARGARVIAVDLSQELLDLARKRLAISKLKLEPQFIVASAYDVPLPDASVDAIFCASLLHHLNVSRAMAEMKRLLKPQGVAVVKEPVRFSKAFGALRSLFSEQEDVSEDEHPLTRAEFAQLKHGWIVSGERAFRLPMIALAIRVLGEQRALKLWPLDRWLLRKGRLQHFATARVLMLTRY
jgi:SAM-dependent methyltransferase